MLAVIVIVSLVAGIATVGLAASSENARLLAAAAQWRDLDARARLYSRTLGPVVMCLDTEREEVTLHLSESGELLSHLLLPQNVTSRLIAEGATDTISFDRLGRSVDYEVQLRSSGRVKAWKVQGLTGLIQEDEP